MSHIKVNTHGGSILFPIKALHLWRRPSTHFMSVGEEEVLLTNGSTYPNRYDKPIDGKEYDRLKGILVDTHVELKTCDGTLLYPRQNIYLESSREADGTQYRVYTPESVVWPIEKKEYNRLKKILAHVPSVDGRPLKRDWNGNPITKETK